MRSAGIEEVTKVAYEAMGRGEFSQMGSFYAPFCFGEGYGGDFRGQAWNKKLGLNEVGEEEIEWIVNGWL